MSGRRIGSEGIGACIFFLLGTGVLISLLEWMRLYWNVLPFWDQWVFLSEYAELQSGFDPKWVEFFFGQHNEHRIVVARLLLIADLEFFKGENKSLLIENLLIQLLTCIVLCRLVWPHLLGSSRKGMALSFALLVLFSAGQVENFIWGFQVQFVGVYAAAIFACFFAVRGRSILACCLAIIATLMMANGVLIWPILMTLAAIQKKSRLAVIAYGVGFLVCLGAYLIGYKSVAGHGSLTYALTHPIQFIEYLLVYLGGFASVGNTSYAIFFGGVELFFLGILFVLAWRQRDRQTGEFWAFLAISVFVLFSACLVAAGRLSFGADQALASRYVTPSSILLVCLAFGWICYTRGVDAKNLKRITTLDAFAMSFALMAVGFVCTNHWHHRGDLIGRHQRLNIASDAIAVGAFDARAYGMAFSDISSVEKASRWLKKHHLSIFSARPWSMLGTKVGIDIPIAPDTRCVGNIDNSKPVTAGADDLATSVRGWAWDKLRNTKPASVLLVDAANRVTGFASEEVARADVALVLGRRSASMTGWAGYNAHGAPFAAYGLIDDASLACKLSLP